MKVSGGIYGIEPLAAGSEPVWLFIGIGVFSIFYAWPLCLLTAEAALMYPVNGGAVRHFFFKLCLSKIFFLQKFDHEENNFFFFARFMWLN